MIVPDGAAALISLNGQSFDQVFKAVFTALDMIPSAWMFELESVSPEGYGDEQMSNHHYLRLVRAGNILQELF